MRSVSRGTAARPVTSLRVPIVTYVALVVLSTALSTGCGEREGPREPPRDDAPGAPAPEPPRPDEPAPPVPSEPEPEITWERRLGGAGDEYVLDVVADARGVTALTWIGSDLWEATRTPVPAALGLVRLDHQGSIVWAEELPNPHGAEVRDLSMASAGWGTVVALRTTCAPAGCLDLGAGPASGSVVLRFDDSGSLMWQAAVEGTLASDVASGGGGDAVVAYRAIDGEPRIRRLDARGATLWEVRAPPMASDLQRYALAVGADGDVIVGAGFALQALDGGGMLRWYTDVGPEAEPSGTDGGIETVGAAEDGTIVATVSFYGAISYAGTQIEWRTGGGGSAFVVAESDGKPRLARRIVAAEFGVTDAAVDPSGRLAIVGRGGSQCGGALWLWEPSSDRLRRAPLACREGSGDWFGEHAVAIDPDTGDAVVGGIALPDGLIGARDVDGLLRSMRF
jgi:hypothetical protein